MGASRDSCQPYGFSDLARWANDNWLAVVAGSTTDTEAPGNQPSGDEATLAYDEDHARAVEQQCVPNCQNRRA